MQLRRYFLLLLLLLGVAAGGADIRAIVVLTETGACQGCTQQPRYKKDFFSLFLEIVVVLPLQCEIT